MDIDERFEMNEEARMTDWYTCECCGATIDGRAALDPIIIDDCIFCDHCASDETYLRLEGFIH